MLAGLDAYTSTFLSNVNAAETRINTANEQLSSGYRINVPSDDPGAIDAILGFQSQIDQVTQIQTNLAQATTLANVSDSALTSANNLLNQLTSIRAQALGSTSSAANNIALADQVQGIGEQMVALANTSFLGGYVFGGDDSSVQPYTANFTTQTVPVVPATIPATTVVTFVTPPGYTQNNTASATVILANSDGDSMLIPSQTAQQIFDTQTSPGVPAAGNILNNIGTLVLALQNNDQTAIQNAGTAVTASITQLGLATTTSGNTINWLQQSSTTATANLNNLQTQLGGLRDADATQAATDLTTAETAMQAAIAAQGTMNIKNLFSYLG